MADESPAAPQPHGDVQEYLEKYHINQLFEDLLASIIHDQPDQPMPFLIAALKRKMGLLPEPKPAAAMEDKSLLNADTNKKSKVVSEAKSKTPSRTKEGREGRGEGRVRPEVPSAAKASKRRAAKAAPHREEDEEFAFERTSAPNRPVSPSSTAPTVSRFRKSNAPDAKAKASSLAALSKASSVRVSSRVPDVDGSSSDESAGVARVAEEDLDSEDGTRAHAAHAHKSQQAPQGRRGASLCSRCGAVIQQEAAAARKASGRASVWDADADARGPQVNASEDPKRDERPPTADGSDGEASEPETVIGGFLSSSPMYNARTPAQTRSQALQEEEEEEEFVPWSTRKAADHAGKAQAPRATTSQWREEEDAMSVASDNVSVVSSRRGAARRQPQHQSRAPQSDEEDF